jgi:hypothetical protein
VSEVENHLDLMNGYLERATAWSVARPALAPALRREILEITKLRLKTGFSQALHDADVALTSAIASFVYHQSDALLEVIHDRMDDYREAVLSSEFDYVPTLPLIELALRRKGWDAAVLGSAD